MPVSKLSEMTWEQVRDLDPERSVAILPVGAIEAHGPHLPLTTDVIISEAMARSAAAKLAARGYEAVILPAFAYTSAGFASGFPGTISLPPDSVTAALVDIARSLARGGLRFLAIANSHLDPAHIRAIAAAVTAIREGAVLSVAFPDVTKKPWVERLSAEFKSGACHAGCYESSVVMAERPELVREEIRAALTPNEASLSDAIRAGLSTFEEAGGPRAYFGSPAEASGEEGEETIDILGGILEEALLDELGS